MFPRLDEQLANLEAHLDQPQRDQLVDEAVNQLNDVLLALENILDRLLEVESYHELIDIVRSIIREQDILLERTRTQQKKKALDLLR